MKKNNFNFFKEEMTKEEMIKYCEWQLRFYDNRRKRNDISEYQRKLAEDSYKTYYTLYNKMVKAKEHENG